MWRGVSKKYIPKEERQEVEETKVAELARGGEVQTRDLPRGRRDSSAAGHCFLVFFVAIKAIAQILAFILKIVSVRSYDIYGG